MKNAFCKAGILVHPDFKKKFILSTDASLVGIGAVVEQEHEGELRPVRFSSKSLIDAQRNWDTTERECWSVVYHLKEFRHLLLGNLDRVITDHNALKWLIHKTDATGKLARWQASLVEYNPLIIEYRPGTENVVADSLSRPPCINVVSALVDNRHVDAWLDELKSVPFYENVIEELETGGSVGDEFSNAGPTKPIIVTKRNELMSVDLIGPLTETDEGNKYILVTVDHFTRWPTSTPIKDKQAVTVASKLIEIFCTFGFPMEMLSDQGSEFVNKIQNTIEELLGIGKIFTTPGHPATNGKVERLNRVIKALLRRFVSVYGKGKDWDKWLPVLQKMGCEI